MRRCWIALAFALIATMATSGVVMTDAQGQPVPMPTPVGQLGGPVPLPGRQAPPAAPAAQASPVAERDGDAPAPDECTIDPIGLEELVPIVEGLAEFDDTESTPVAVADIESLPPADEETVEAVSLTVREFIACTNGGDYPRLLALFSETYLPRFFATIAIDDPEELGELFSEPQPLPESEWITLIGIGPVGLLPHGRAVARVTGDDPTSDAAEQSPTFIFIEEGDRWLVDEIIEDEADEMATPVN